MKKIFQKAMTVAGSAFLVGSSVALAAAASYPEPFTSNTAIVVGANAAPSDNIAASEIAGKLDAASAGSSMTATTIDGESYKLEKSSTKFHLGDTITAVVSTTADDDDLPTLLKDGVFIDDDNDEFDYTQKVTLKALQLKQFNDNDYADDEPTLGFSISAGSDVLDYTIDFSDEPLLADLATADLMLMGKNYYILSVSNDGSGNTILTLLDSASDTLLSEGESTTITAGSKSYTVSIDFVSSSEAKLTINGETTNSLAEGQTYKLSDGSYVGLKDILYSSKDTGISKVEFSIGSGKLVLTSGSDIELNEDSIPDLSVTITNTTTALQDITINWDAEDDLFITPTSSISMPAFEALSLSFTGINWPAEEEIEITDDGDESIKLSNFPLKDGEADINLLYATTGGAWAGLGTDATHQLRTSNTTSLTFDSDTDDYFVVSWTDGSDAESYLMRATNFKLDGSTNRTTFQYWSGTGFVDAQSDQKEGDTFSMGNVDLGVNTVNRVDHSVTINANNSNTDFHTLYSAEGLKVYLPFTASSNVTSSITYPGAISFGAIATGMNNATAFALVMHEEDKDDDKAAGDMINVTLGWNSQTTPEPSVTAYYTSNTDATSTELGNTDVYQDWTYSALATQILYDQGPDKRSLKLVYHGTEATADVYLTSSDAVVSEGGSAGVMTVLDTAVSTVAGKNLIVVGGSAINSVAAELLGGAYSEAKFTEMTGVGAGKFMIQSFDRAGKTALLVAGYNAADTTKAATYLVNNAVDTSTGKKYIGASATSAELVTETA